MALTATQFATVAVLVQQFSDQSEALKTAAADAALAAWSTFDGWYNFADVANLAAEFARLSLANQQTTSGLSTTFMSLVTSEVTGQRPTVSKRQWTPVRGGADPVKVFARPAQVYQRAIALGADHQEAINRAVGRAAGTLQSDITLEDRQTQQRVLGQLGIVQFRRIIHPELSASGTCGLCIAASSRTYSVGTLMPLHPPSCRCTVMPVVGENDPGKDLNDADLRQLYADAGSTKAADLSRTRYRVDEHGELGPVISRAEDNFRGPGQSRLEDDPARALRMLEAARPTLMRFEAGEDPGGGHATERLAYQRNLIAKLERIVGSAA